MTEIDVKLIEQGVALVKAVIWPVAVLTVVLMFRDGLKHFFATLSEMSFKAAGIEWSAKVASAAANLEAAEKAKPLDPKSKQEPPARKSDVARSLRFIAAPAVARTLQGKVVLWVDDKPHGNFYEAQALRDLGLEVIQLESSDSASAFMERQAADLVITDLKRGLDADAGLKFLADALKRRPGQKVIVYTGYTDVARHQAAIEAGAIAATSGPRALINLVVTALTS